MNLIWLKNKKQKLDNDFNSQNLKFSDRDRASELKRTHRLADLILKDKESKLYEY